MTDQTPRTGLSLYANLLDPGNAGPGSDGDAAVTSKQAVGGSATATTTADEAAKKQQALAASLRFQPTRRPQQQNAAASISAAAAAAASAKAKAKAIASRLSATGSGSVNGSSNAADSPSGAKAAHDNDDGPTPPSLATAPKTTAADWVATASDDEWNYGTEKRGRAGRKNKKRKAKEAQLLRQDWDDIYDPTRPNSYEEYKHSDEKVREVREWRELLYKHRHSERRSRDSYDSEGSESFGRPAANKLSRLFAPPSNLNSSSKAANDDDEEDDDIRPYSPPADVPDDPTGEDAYARRLQMSQSQFQSQPQTQPQPGPMPVGQISRAPVRYTLPVAPPGDELESEIAASGIGGTNDGGKDSDDKVPSNLPGQTGFAERLMAKYGWSKGQGLGAKGTGITTALYAQAEKRKKKSDAEGGGFATPASMGKIMGGQKSKEALAEEEGRFGAMSEVVRLGGMLDGIDIDAEMNADGGGIVQEIGDECDSKYGSVERVYIHRKAEAEPAVFVHFVSALSALRAVNALDGRMFGGNTINARFWNKEKFLADEYE